MHMDGCYAPRTHAVVVLFGYCIYINILNIIHFLITSVNTLLLLKTAYETWHKSGVVHRDDAGICPLVWDGMSCILHISLITDTSTIIWSVLNCYFSHKPDYYIIELRKALIHFCYTFYYWLGRNDSFTFTCM